MIGFVNNLSPGFLLSYVAVEQLQLSRFAWCVPVSVLGSALLMGLAGKHHPSLAWHPHKPEKRENSGEIPHTAYIRKDSDLQNASKARQKPESQVPAKEYQNPQEQQGPAPGSTFADVLDECIFDAMESALRLCAYILLFAILSGALMQAAPINNPFVMLLVSSIEVTNGTRLLAQSALPFHAKYLAISALAAFGGCSALAQSIGIAHMDREFLLRYIKSRVNITLLAILFAAAALLLQNKIPWPR